MPHQRRPFPRWKSSALLLSCLLSVLSAPAEDTPPSSGGLAAKLQPFVDHQAIAGAVMLIASKDKIIDLEAVGYSDFTAKKPMKVDDMFWIASMSKAMTASALMMLVDEGKVNLDDPVEKYLPEFKGQMVVSKSDPAHVPHAPSHPITIREILSHTAGLRFKSSIEGAQLDQKPLAERVVSYGKDPLQSDPGTEYSYANEGINTAGRIVEVVSGMPYEQFMQQRIFQPLGMNDTTFWPTTDQVQRLAKSYVGQSQDPKLTGKDIDQLTYPLNDRQNRFPMPAGGLFSTAADVAKFCQMFLNEGVFDGKNYLTADSIKKATTKETPPAVTKTYGFGWDVAPDGSYSHGGAYHTYMQVDPQRKIVLVYLVQMIGKSADEEKQTIPTFVKAARDLVGNPNPPGAKITTEGQGQPH